MHSSSHDPRNQDGLSCSTVRDILHIFTEGEIDPFRARLVRGHLRGCGPCRDERRALDAERIWLVEAMVKSPPLSGRLREKVIDRIRRRERAVRSRRRSSFFLRASGLAAAAALAAGLAVAFQGGGTEMEPSLLAGNERVHAPAAPVHLAEHRPETAIVPTEDARPVPAAGEEVEAAFASARPTSFGDVLGIVHRIGPAEAVHPGEPCPPDPNRDGKVDLIDVAYSCQIIMGGLPPGGLAEVPAAVADPECEEDCLRV